LIFAHLILDENGVSWLIFSYFLYFAVYMQWDVLRDEDACELVCKEMRIAQAVSNGRLCHDLLASTAAESLVKSSLKAGTMDNVTVVVGIFHYTAR